LHLGDTGNAVKCLQIALVAAGFPLPGSTKRGTVRADGIFGLETQGAVIKFQQSNGLQADGLAGRMTLTRLDQILLQGTRDPLRMAILDCRESGAKLLRSLKGDAVGSAERSDFQRKLGDLDQLLFGDPMRQGIKIQSFVSEMFA
jgi:peptidoglycan hydrolase-like protein with peptidoglycan-binding domain